MHAPGHSTRDLFVATAAGIGLAWTVVLLKGVLSAIAIPRPFFEALKGHSAVAYLLHTTLLVQFPAAVLSFLVGALLIRLLGTSFRRFMFICAVPWLVYVAVNASGHIAASQWPALVTAGMLLHWQSLPGILAVPGGLWLAAKASQRKAAKESERVVAVTP